MLRNQHYRYHGHVWNKINLILFSKKIRDSDFAFILKYILPVLFITLVLNITFLVLDEKCCCNQSRSCVPKICCGASCYDYKYNYIDTTDEIMIWQCDDKHEK